MCETTLCSTFRLYYPRINIFFTLTITEYLLLYVIIHLIGIPDQISNQIAEEPSIHCIHTLYFCSYRKVIFIQYPCKMWFAQKRVIFAHMSALLFSPALFLALHFYPFFFVLSILFQFFLVLYHCLFLFVLHIYCYQVKEE